MKKVLVVNELLIGGGVENVMRDLILALPEEEYQVTLMTLLENKDVSGVEYLKRICYRPLRLAYKMDDYPRRSVRHILCAVMRRVYQTAVKLWVSLSGFDVVIAMEEGLCHKLLANVRAGKKLAWVHCDYANNHWTAYAFANNEAERQCMAKYDRVVCVSNTVAEDLKLTIGDPGNVCVRYNPIDEKVILAAAQKSVPLPERSTAPLFVTVGRLCEAKGYGRLQDVCKRLNDEGLQYELWIIGGGELEKELKDQKEALCLDNVRYLGSQSNPFAYMKQGDWVLCSSVSEGFSTVLQEATVLGVPIFSTNCSGVVELLGDSEYGIVVENDDQALYEGMKRVLQESHLREHYQKMAAQRQDFVNLEKRIESIKELL